MLINFSNHPYSSWSQAQRSAAQIYGAVVDLPFPAVAPTADTAGISALADKCCCDMLRLRPDAVLVQGEMSLSFAVANLLARMGVPALCACSERDCVSSVAEDGSSVRRSVFRFVRFREY